MIWRELAKEVVGLDSAMITKEAVNEAKYVFLDWLGCAIAGTQDTVSLRRALNRVEWAGGRPEATLIGFDRRTSLYSAVLANGIVGRTLGLFEAIGPSGLLVCSSVVPASLSLTEKHGRAGHDFLAAIVVGYEVAAYLGRIQSSLARAIGSNGQIESCAAAAAAAWILGLNIDAAASALAMAWSQPVAPPALNGVLAACAAEERAIYPPAAWFGSDAACESISEAPAGGSLHWDALRYRHVRLHAVDRNVHAAVDAALELKMAYRLHPEDIEAIEVHLSSQSIAGNPSGDPDTVQGLQRSIPYCLALAFLRGRVGPGEFSLQNLLKAPVGWLMANTAVQEDKIFSEDPACAHGARVIVRTRYKTAHENIVLNPRGSVENPVSQAEMEDKFRYLITTSFSAEMASLLISRVLALDNLQDINGLFSDLSKQSWTDR